MFMLNLHLKIHSRRPQVWNLRGLRQLHLRRISGHYWLWGEGCPSIRGLECGLREARWLLCPALRYGSWLLHFRQTSEQYGQIDGVFLQLASVSDLCGNTAKLLGHPNALQPVEELWRHPGLVGIRGEYNRLLWQQSGRNSAQRRSWSLERSRYGGYL